MSRTLAVVLRPGLGADREDTVLRTIAALDGVRGVTRVSPTARSARLRRLATVEVADDGDLSRVLTLLGGMAEVEAAAPAAARSPAGRPPPHTDPGSLA